MTDEGAKVLAAAIEKLADAISRQPHVILQPYPYPQPAQQVWPQQQPWESPFFVTTCDSR